MDTREDSLLLTDTRVETLTGTDALDIRVPGLTVLCHPDPERVGERAPLPGLTADQEVLLSRREPYFGAPKILDLRPLGDPHLSRSPIRLLPEDDGAVRLVCRETMTSVVADGEQVVGERLFTADEIERGAVLLLANRIALLLHSLEPFLTQRAPGYGMVGASPAIVRVRREIERTCDLQVPILIRGETGTGKELVAQAVHQASPRQEGPFVAVNMGAVPASLAAAEIFGATRGAFTGADKKRAGYFIQAEGGTLFLDEIAESPPEIQVMLLRALETLTIQPVGAAEPRKVDVRLVAATDADLEAAVSDGRFREQLLHRLSGYEIRLPPLRERREDIGRLLYHFLYEELKAIGEADKLKPHSKKRPWVSAELVARLVAFDWPGNVRQLRNAVRQMVIASRDASSLRPGPQVKEMLKDIRRPARRRRTSDLSDSTVVDGNGVEVTVEELEEAAAVAAARQKAQKAAVPAKPRRANYRSPAEISEEALIDTLRAHRFRLQPTAAALGISRTSLYDLIEKNPRFRKAVDLSREEIEEAKAQLHGDLEAMVDHFEVSKRGLLRRMTQLGMR